LLSRGMLCWRVTEMSKSYLTFSAGPLHASHFLIIKNGPGYIGTSVITVTMNLYILNNTISSFDLSFKYAIQFKKNIIKIKAKCLEKKLCMSHFLI